MQFVIVRVCVCVSHMMVVIHAIINSQEGEVGCHFFLCHVHSTKNCDAMDLGINATTLAHLDGHFNDSIVLCTNTSYCKYCIWNYM